MKNRIKLFYNYEKKLRTKINNFKVKPRQIL